MGAIDFCGTVQSNGKHQSKQSQSQLLSVTEPQRSQLNVNSTIKINGTHLDTDAGAQCEWTLKLENAYFAIHL